jgi:hypothetical protein
MTPYRAGEILGALTGQLIVTGLLWLVLVLVTLLVARVLGRRLPLRRVAGNLWILGFVAALFILQMVSTLGPLSHRRAG